MKGRPPGTPKSDDPNKKKRRRTARQRDLCDVKIKITEHFPASMTPADVVSHMAQLPPELQTVNPFFNPGDNPRENQPFGVLTPNPTLPEGHPAAHGARYFTIQRVNGNGANGKADGVGGGHRHTLEESDRVKKNSVQRWMLKEAKEQKKAMVSPSFPLIVSGLHRWFLSLSIKAILCLQLDACKGFQLHESQKSI